MRSTRRSPPTTGASTGPEPYLGPQPYERADADRFHGRRVEAFELFSQVLSSQVTLLHAQSGAGKTSLLRAGLQPLLEEHGFDLLPVARVMAPALSENRSGRNIYSAGVVSYLDPQSRSQGLATHLRARQRPPGTPLALMLDQFEELFTFCPERWSDRSAFFDDLRAAINADPLLRVVLSLREDYLASVEPFLESLPVANRGRYRLPRLDEEGALAAVEEPLGGIGWAYAEGVARKLVRDLRTVQVLDAQGRTQSVQGESVEPVQLQVVCQQLWRAVSVRAEDGSGRTITESDVRNYGDVTKALSTFYDSAVRRAVIASGEPEWRLRQWFEQKLITAAGTRGIVYRGPRLTEGIRNSAIDVLEGEHVVRPELRAGERWYELTHDRLIGPIRAANQSARSSRPAWAGRQRLLLTVGLLVLLAASIVALALFRSEAGTGTGRALAVVVLAVVPADPYFVSLRQQVPALWERYVVTLFRLQADSPRNLPEPPESSPYHATWLQAGGLIDDTQNLYLRKFEAVYGRGVLRARRGYGHVFSSGQGLASVAAVVALGVVGWTVLLHPFDPSPSPVIAVLDRAGAVAVSPHLLSFAVASAAFLGGYFALLQDVIVRYVTGELGSAAYSSAAVALPIYVLLAVLLNMLLGLSSGLSLIVGGVIGYLGPSLTPVLRRTLRQFRPLAKPRLGSEHHPLRELEGMTPWEEARLNEQGIEDAQNLITANIVDLLISTRVPVARLVDWIDQALLILHIDQHARQALRRVGVRTATDLLAVVDEPGLPVDRLAATTLSRQPALSLVQAWRRGSAHTGPAETPTAAPVVVLPMTRSARRED